MIDFKVPYNVINDKVLVLADKKVTEERGLVIPDAFARPKYEGTVVAVGPGKMLKDGNRVPMTVKVGDRVIYSEYIIDRYKMGDDIELHLMQEFDIFGVYDGRCK